MSRKIRICLLVLTAIMIGSSAAFAEGPRLRSDGSLVSGMVGYTSHESKNTGDQIGGGTWSFNYSRADVGRNWAAGIVVRRMDTDEEFTNTSGETTHITAARLIVAMQGRWFATDGRLTSYLSPLAGIHLQTTDTYLEDEVDFRDSSYTLTLGVSAGAMFHLTDAVFMRGEYTFHYFAKSDTIKNNHMHGLYAGLGFQFGGI